MFDDLKELLKILRENGVTKYVTEEVSIDLGELPVLVKAPDQLTEAQQQEVLKKIETMKSVMQLDDDNLLDRLFPEPKEESDEL